MRCSFYRNKSEKFFIGRRVRTLVPLKNAVAELPVGTVAVVTRKIKGFTIRTDPCETCGIAISVSRVAPEDVDLIDIPLRQKPGIKPGTKRNKKESEALNDLLQ